jgi:serine phosphatase RsbU (regulator of sigma subunit)
MQDGYSTAGSLGTGLGAIRRQADHFEIYTQPNDGSLIVARMWSEAGGGGEARSLSGINVPKSGESVSGDAWASHVDGALATLIVVDGLGHGPQAADASNAAIRVFRQRAGLAPADMIEEIHSALRATRGAAVSVATVDRDRQIVRFAGVGNVAASMVSPLAPRQGLASHNGTAGVTMRRVQEFTYPIRPHDVLVMHSDGINTHWNAENHTGLWRRDPALIAAAIYRDHTRGRDDSTVVVARLDR